ncbi:hypothetical protein NHF46_11820 [Arthrobacter alpinus]|nr:hypothetical protein [Arthrobacter alpinus]
MTHINAREHRATKRKPAAMLTEESLRLHRVPDDAHTVSFGLARTVPPNTPMVTFNNAMYSVPSHLLGQRVFVRSHGTGPDEKVIVVHHTPAGPVEVARHGRARPGARRSMTSISPDTWRKSLVTTRPGPAPAPKQSSWPSAAAPWPG